MDKIKNRILDESFYKFFKKKPFKRNEINSLLNQQLKTEKGFGQLVNYTNQKIEAHVGLDRIGIINPSIMKFQTCSGNKFMNTHSYELYKEGLILTSERNYLHSCKFFSQNLVKSRGAKFQYLVEWTSELIKFEDSEDIYILIIGRILTKLSLQVILPQYTYFIDEQGEKLINESLLLNHLALKNTFFRFFQQKQLKIFNLIITYKGDYEMAQEVALEMGIFNSLENFKKKESLVKTNLNEYLNCEDLSVENFCAIYQIVLNRTTFKLTLTS